MAFDLDAAKKQYRKCKKLYYENGTSPLTDAEFDKLEAQIRKADPDWADLHKTGHKIGKKTSTALFTWMPSLDKVHDDDEPALLRWAEKQDSTFFLVMPKLDGNAFELTYDGGVPTKLVTRGDGTKGKDVSYFLPYLTKLPQKIAIKKHLVLRVEVIMDINVFNAKWSKQFDAARNMVSGLLNRQDVHKALADLDVVVLRVLGRGGQKMSIPLDDGHEFSRMLGFNVVKGKLVTPKSLNSKRLTELMQGWRKSYPYEQDGVVIGRDGDTDHTEENPSWAIAFKQNDLANAPTTEIIGHEWEVTKHGRLVPKAKVRTVQVSGAKVSNVTVNNLKWAMDRGLGIGAKVKIVRSGEIIPKIVEVVKAVPLVVPPEYKWHWDENGTHAMIDQKHHGQDAITVEKFKHFFGTLEIDHASEALAKALVAAGVQSTVDLTAIDPYEASGYSKAILAKVIPQVEKLQKEGAPLPKLAKASGVFPNGVGERRIQKLLDNDLDVKHLAWNWDKQSNHAKAAYTQSICVVLGPNVGMQVVDNLQAFGVWLGASMIPVKAPSKKAKKAGSKLAGTGVTFTGFRDKIFENVILDNGGDVVDFGSKTTVLIISLSGKASGKIDKAKEKGIPVLTIAQFKEKHGV